MWKRLGISSFCILAGLMIGFAGGRYSVRPSAPVGRQPPHYMNTARARLIKPGAALSRVIYELGDPVGASDGWLVFDGSPPSGGPIRVKVGASGLVEAIDLGVD